jgi:ankyrin repeat protein
VIILILKVISDSLDRLNLLSLYHTLKMAVEELYIIGESYLAPIKHDTIWTVYAEGLHKAAYPYKSLMDLIQTILESTSGPVARTIISATFALVGSPRDPTYTTTYFNHASYYARLGHHGIACVLKMYEVMAHPHSGPSEAPHLIKYRKIFLQDWTRTCLKLGLDKDQSALELRDAGFHITDSQLFVPKAVLQVPAVLEEVGRDGRADCLGRPISFIEHDAGLPLPPLDTRTAQPDILGRTHAHIAYFDNGRSPDTWPSPVVSALRVCTWDSELRCNFLGLSFLHLASIRGHTDRFKKLQQISGDLPLFRRVYQAFNEPSPVTGRTCLHWAASCGHVDTVHFLCNGTDFVDKCDERNRSAIHLAARYGHTGVIQCLLQYARVSTFDLRDKHHCTPFWYAASEGHLAIVRILGRYANIDGKDKHGYTPLAIAALEGHVEVVRFLLSLNSDDNIRADPNTSDYNEHTPLDNAIYGSHLKCMELLREHGGVEGRHISVDSGSSDIEDHDLSSDEEALT